MGAEFPTASIDALALSGIRLNQSYVMQLCSPTRGSLLSSRFAYNVGMDGDVLTGGATRCLNTTVRTLGDRVSARGVRTAFIGKYDVGYSSWACTANCRGFDYWLGYYGAAEDYYLHGSGKALDFHENFQQAPQYRGEYSTGLFVRKGIEWATNATAAAGGAAGKTLLYLSFQAVHGPIEMPPENYTAACGHITDGKRKTYCSMMQALDAGIGSLTAAYRRLGIFDDTVFLFLADNGGMHDEGGFNVPLRGQKATIWEVRCASCAPMIRHRRIPLIPAPQGGVRSQTFVHWSGYDARTVGSMWGGLAHAVDWGVTLEAALLDPGAGASPPPPAPGEPPLDGMNLWPALTAGSPSPRTEMLLSMRDAGQCGTGFASCAYAGQLAYRNGRYKLLYGHTALRGNGGDQCAWTKGGLECWNGWGVPRDVGPSRPPPRLPAAPGQPANTSAYSWGAVLLFDIEADPLEEHDLSATMPGTVTRLRAQLEAYARLNISQSTGKARGARDTETCGDKLACAVPWLPDPPGATCAGAPPVPPPGPGPAPPPPPPGPPGPPAPGTNCCQCLREGGSRACGPAFCHRHGGACATCVAGGGGASCRPKCGCKDAAGGAARVA